jgi:hypothetical protein
LSLSDQVVDSVQRMVKTGTITNESLKLNVYLKSLVNTITLQVQQ